jgi:hypothetical protein
MTAATSPSTSASFIYIDPTTLTPGVKPWNKVDTAEGVSFGLTTRDLPVYDARAEAADFKDVDRTGFAFHTFPSNVPASEVLSDGPRVRTDYYAEVEAALRAKLATGPEVKKVMIFDHTIRVNDPKAARQPVQRVHVDQTPAAAETRVRRHTGAEADELLKGRFQLINVWRPLGHNASDYPLGVIDWRSATNKDLIAIDLLYPDRQDGDNDDRGKEVRPDEVSYNSTEGYKVGGETYSVAPSDSHRFYYVKDMRPDEVMFLKCFDSESEDVKPGTGIAGFTPHTAFIDRKTPADAKPRQSIEVRCLVFYD